MGKCKSCNCGDMIPGHDKIKDGNKQYEMYICTNCDTQDYQVIIMKKDKK